MPNDFATLSNENRDELIKPLLKRKVFRTLKSMSHGKSLGPYGLIYVFYWNVIGDHLFKTFSKFFFLTSNLPPSWGKTFVVLIPKKENPIFLIADFKPISHCNVCYKIT